MLKNKIEKVFKESISKGIEKHELGSLTEVPEQIAVEFPKQAEHGDRAVNIAMRLSKESKIPPRQIAETIVTNLDKGFFSAVDIAGPGFINLRLDWKLLGECIREIHQEDHAYGQLSERPDKSFSRVLLEYVSANPTGDLHIGHGRQAVLGSALANLLKRAGYYVESEFYINDAGAQIDKLARSAHLAILIQEAKAKTEDYPDTEEYYPLNSMLEFLTPDFYRKPLHGFLQKHSLSLEELSRDKLDLEFCGNLAQKRFLEVQRQILKEIKVEFDTWYSEKNNLHQGNDHKVANTLQTLINKGYVYEQEGALWFKAKEFGDERDRVLKKSDGTVTYLCADAAYHQDKLSRHFDKLINLWGGDHHGQVPGIKGILQALGEPADRLEVILIQMVSLSSGGQEVKMSKRTGNIITVRDLIEEVGTDALRYFLVESQANNRMVFDLDLAKRQDKDNPVYYIQYAHARCASILRTLTAEQINQENLSNPAVEAATLSQAELESWLNSFKTESDILNIFTRVSLSEEELSSTRSLILHLIKFPEEISEAAFTRSPYKIANYLKDLAGAFHHFYAHNRVITENRELMRARIAIVAATQKLIRNGLNILGIKAPDKM
jgi:arginyl-tRNA synthetase